MNAHELYRAGKLQEAIVAQSEDVKRNAADAARRGFLCELYCFTPDLEKVDRQLDAIAGLDVEAAVGVSLWRQILRAEQHRRQFWTEGRLPEFLEQPSPALRLYLEAAVRLRAGEAKEAVRLLAEADEQRPAVSGTRDGQPFTAWRDLDDMTAGFFEVLTSTGKYYWIPVENVELIEFRPPARPRDLLWQRVHMVVRGGPDGEVYLPALYAGSENEADANLPLGRATDWRGGDSTPTRGAGLRTFLIGEDDIPIFEIKEVVFAS